MKGEREGGRVVRWESERGVRGRKGGREVKERIRIR
jgi:hypothetical protein